MAASPAPFSLNAVPEIHFGAGRAGALADDVKAAAPDAARVLLVADAILRALEMPLEERKQRWRAMMDNIAEQDVGWWRARFVALLDPEEVETNPRREVALEIGRAQGGTPVT